MPEFNRTSEQRRLLKLQEKKRAEDKIRQRAFDRGYRAGYAAAIQSLDEGKQVGQRSVAAGSASLA